MTPFDQAPEHEFEAAPGLPEALPADETLLWQGAPDWRLLAREALHLRAFAGYFGLLLAWRFVTVLADGSGSLAANAAQGAYAVVALLPLAVLALGLLALFAWLSSRTTVYTVTDRRVVMRIGIVLSITFNLPFSRIDAAALRSRPDGSGDLSLRLADTDRIAYLHLWPHARPWQLRRTEPTLRALRDASSVATLLSKALAASLAPQAPAAAQAPPAAQAVRPVRLRPAAAAGAAPAGTHAQPASQGPQPLAA